MNAGNERGSDSEDFGVRITEIRVAVAKIWRKEFQGPICNFWKVARAISGNTFRFWGAVWNIGGLCVDLWQKQGLFVKLAMILGWGFIFE
jgi:hypothetical protein